MTHERGLVRVSAVTHGEYDDLESKTLPTSRKVAEELRIEVGDLLLARANGNTKLVGACVIVKKVSRPVFLSDKVLRLVVAEPLRRWIHLVLISPQGRNQIEALATGGQLEMRNLSQANLKKIRVSVPPAEEMLKIAAQVAGSLEEMQKVSLKAEQTATQLNNLRSSILARAFRGELVPQDPNDEPASELLARIKGAKTISHPASIKQPGRGRT